MAKLQLVLLVGMALQLKCIVGANICHTRAERLF